MGGPSGSLGGPGSAVVAAGVGVTAGSAAAAMPEKAGQVVTQALVDDIFFQIPQILSYHEQFLEKLRGRLEYWDAKRDTIGDWFLECVSIHQEIF